MLRTLITTVLWLCWVTTHAQLEQFVVGHLDWSWQADGDPFAINTNADGQPDWAERNGAPFITGELSTISGRTVWERSGGFDVVVDTAPRYKIGNAQATVMARATSASPPENGVVWWLNFDQTKLVGEPAGMAAVNLRISLDGGSGTQTVSWYMNTTALGDSVLTNQVTGLTTDFLRVEIDYLADIDQVAYEVFNDQTGAMLHQGQFTYLPVLVNNDEFATILVWPGGSARGQVDFVSLEADLIELREPSAAPEIIQPTYESGVMRLSITGLVAGTTYHLERGLDLQQTNFQIITDFVAAGSTTNLVDSPPALEQQAYYRLRKD
ncbi:MAG: hypothetical protein VCG02_19660 [Verrucomicrobiota bacterium]